MRARREVIVITLGWSLACAGIDDGPVLQPLPLGPSNWLWVVIDRAPSGGLALAPPFEKTGATFISAFGAAHPDAGHGALLFGGLSQTTGIRHQVPPDWALPAERCLATLLEPVDTLYAGPWRLGAEPAACGFDVHVPTLDDLGSALAALESPWVAVVAVSDADAANGLLDRLAPVLDPAERDTTWVVVGAAGVEGSPLLSEASWAVPLWIHGPQVEPGESTSLVHTIDLLPTVLADLGQPVPDTLEGQPIIEILADRGAWSARSELLTESAAGWALRDARYKAALPQRGRGWAQDLEDGGDAGPHLNVEALSGQARIRVRRLQELLASEADPSR